MSNTSHLMLPAPSWRIASGFFSQFMLGNLFLMCVNFAGCQVPQYKWIEYLRGSCKPSNDLPLWTDSILLCKLQKQHRSRHEEDGKLALNQRRTWTSDLAPWTSGAMQVLQQNHFLVAWEPWWTRKPFIIWCWVLFSVGTQVKIIVLSVGPYSLTAWRSPDVIFSVGKTLLQHLLLSPLLCNTTTSCCCFLFSAELSQYSKTERVSAKRFLRVLKALTPPPPQLSWGIIDK